MHLVLVMLLLAFSGLASGSPSEGAPDAGQAPAIGQREPEETSPKDAEAQYQSALRMIGAGDYDGAIRALRSAVALKPGYLDAWTELGKALTKVKDFPGGIAAYERALFLDPQNGSLISSIAYGYLYLENWSKAEEYYKMLAERDSSSYDANVHLGFIYQKRGFADWAISAYTKAVAIDPKDASTMGILADLYEAKGADDKRMEYLEKGVAAAPENAALKTELGSAYLKKKEYDKALPIFEDLTTNYPNEPAYHQSLSLVLMQIRDRKADAAAELEKVIALKGDDASILAILALIYNELGQYDKAVAAATQGLEAKQGQEAMLSYQCGAALSKLGRYDDAIAMFSKVVETKDPRWSEAARKQIERQTALKKRTEAKRQQ